MSAAQAVLLNRIESLDMRESMDLKQLAVCAHNVISCNSFDIPRAMETLSNNYARCFLNDLM